MLCFFVMSLKHCHFLRQGNFSCHFPDDLSCFYICLRFLCLFLKPSHVLAVFLFFLTMSFFCHVFVIFCHLLETLSFSVTGLSIFWKCLFCHVLSWLSFPCNLVYNCFAILLPALCRKGRKGKQRKRKERKNAKEGKEGFQEERQDMGKKNKKRMI